ncbi:MAG: hypothetical protein ABL914_00880 [Novosphingobium sp.]
MSKILILNLLALLSNLVHIFRAFSEDVTHYQFAPTKAFSKPD